MLEATLDSERRSTRQLRGLYEISASFAESLSLDATLAAVTKTMVELFDLDAAVIRMPGARGEVLESKAIYVGEPALRETAEQLLALPQPMDAPLARQAAPVGPPRASPAGHGATAATRTGSSSRSSPREEVRPSSLSRLRARPWAR